MSTRLRAALTAASVAVAVTGGLAVATGLPTDTATTPAIGHVWTILLENSEFEQTFIADRNDAPYLTQELPSQGKLVVGYYGTGHSSLDNYLAMTSGQGPKPETQDDCDDPSVVPDAPLDADGQLVGPGCTYPERVLNIADQLDAKGISWKGYMQGMDARPATRRTTCSHPGAPVGGLAPARVTATESYKNKHNPWAYYQSTYGHALPDGSYSKQASCDEHVVPLGYLADGQLKGQLADDLASVATTPAYSYLTPDQCDDGHDACNGKTKYQGVDDFLKVTVPAIMASPAYQQDGLIIITTDEGVTDLACCGEKKSPNLDITEGNGYLPGPVADGGGKVGAILLSRFVTPGTVDVLHSFNHYSYLRSMEDLFGITSGGTDGKGHLGYAADSGLETFQEAGLFDAS